MSIGSTLRAWFLLVILLLVPAASAPAQSLEVRGFFDIGAEIFTASDTFNAVTGSSVGMVFGGGGGVVLPQKIFIDARASRYKKDGERVFVDNGEVFTLGIPNTITITPFEITAGYRAGRSRDTVRPYGGGGISWYRYEETDQFASTAEAVKDTFTGFHLLGGAEFRLGKWLAAAGEVSWASIPDALGQEPGSAGLAFGETDLGGTTVRAKVIFGR